ncbi:MAG: LysR family transcriptional regulator [Bacteroidales bacterium]|jgi:molybdate transport repressor ModE-like protein
MAGPKGSKYYDIFLRHQLEMVAGEQTLINEEGFRLLVSLEKNLSIVAASKEMGISYRKAWGMIRDIEYQLGFQLVGKRRGGKAGGRTTFTAAGKELIDAYRSLIDDLEASDKEIIKTFFRKINQMTDLKR